MTILHVGDADRDPARFAPHRLAGERIDVAIIPDWYLSAAPGAAGLAWRDRPGSSG
jgi:hypothetical protein